MARTFYLTVVFVSFTVLCQGCGREYASAPKPASPATTQSIDESYRLPADVAADLPASTPATSMSEEYFAAESAEAGRDFDYGDITHSRSNRPGKDVWRGSTEMDEGAASESDGFRYGDRREPKRYDDYATRPQRPQSGILTAGSTDDHKAFEEYQRFLNDGLNRIPTARLIIGQRVQIQVTDEQGTPVGDARVEIRQGQYKTSDRPLIDLVTGSDGRTMWLTGLDGGVQASQASVTVYPPNGGKPISRQMRPDHQPWRIVLPQTESCLPTQLDLALVIDTTGSMGDELEYLKSEIDEIALTIRSLFPNVDQRYALIVYRDQGDQYVMQSHRFTSSLSEFRSTLGVQRASGGGDYPEAVHLALDAATHLDWRRQNTARMLFLIGDAPPHDQYIPTTYNALQDLRDQGVRTFPVASSGVEWKAEFIFRAASFLTMGKYLFLTDHSGVGNPHAAPHVSSYQVEHLNHLMVRMVAEQLAGRELAAEEILAVEQTGQPFPPAQPYQQVSRDVPTCPVQPESCCVAASSISWDWTDAVPARWLLLGLVVCGAFVMDFLRDRWRVC